jgi:hypothetical protein
MQVQEHSTVREGLVVGLLGGLIVAVWYLVVDAAAGRPFQTPNALGGVFFRGDANPGARAIVPSLIVGFAILHLITFVAVGMGLTLVVHLASRNLALRMGLWIGLVVAFFFLAGLTYMLTAATAERVPPWRIVLGSLLGVVVMGWYLWRRHPRMGADAPLGAEVKTPRHAPGSPQH